MSSSSMRCTPGSVAYYMQGGGAVGLQHSVFQASGDWSENMYFNNFLLSGKKCLGAALVKKNMYFSTKKRL